MITQDQIVRELLGWLKATRSRVSTTLARSDQVLAQARDTLSKIDTDMAARGRRPVRRPAHGDTGLTLTTLVFEGLDTPAEWDVVSVLLAALPDVIEAPVSMARGRAIVLHADRDPEYLVAALRSMDVTARVTRTCPAPPMPAPLAERAAEQRGGARQPKRR